MITYDENGTPIRYEAPSGKTVEFDARDQDELPPRQIGARKCVDVISTVRSTVESIKDSYTKDSDTPKSILVGMDGSHSGYFNRNQYFYDVAGAKKYIGSWLMEGGRPYIKDHKRNTAQNVMGRIKKSTFVELPKDQGLTQFDVEVTDKEQIERIIDQRALSVSVGQRPVEGVLCSNCSHDLFNGGATPKRYSLDNKPTDEWLDQVADGWHSITNLEIWDVKKTEDSKEWTALCRHRRHEEAPRGGNKFDKIGWKFQGNIGEEVSDVLFGADVNETTGRFAKIREILNAADSLEGDAKDRYVEEELSRFGGDVGIDRSRFAVIASAQDLYVPVSEAEAVRLASHLDPATQFFDATSWSVAQLTADGYNAQVAAYYALGGRFIAPQDKPEITIAQALDMSPRAFGAWYRGPGMKLTQDERDVVSKLHFLRQTNKARA